MVINCQWTECPSGDAVLTPEFQDVHRTLSGSSSLMQMLGWKRPNVSLPQPMLCRTSLPTAGASVHRERGPQGLGAESPLGRSQCHEQRICFLFPKVSGCHSKNLPLPGTDHPPNFPGSSGLSSIPFQSLWQSPVLSPPCGHPRPWGPAGTPGLDCPSSRSWCSV